METMEIGGQEYLVTGTVRIENLGLTLPVVDLPMMSDERWQKLAQENAVRNYTRVFSHAPESVAVALAWQRAEACGRRETA